MRVACRRASCAERGGSAAGPKPGRVGFCGELGRAALQRTNGQEVFVTNGSNISSGKRDQSLCATRRCNELYFNRVGAVDLYHGAKISTPKPLLRKIAIQYNGIEFFVAHDLVSRICSHQLRVCLAIENDPNGYQARLSPRRPYEGTTDLVLQTVLASLPGNRFT